MFLASLLLAASAAVTPAEMKALYEEVKTPFKVGAVMRAEKGTMIDNPCVYRTDDGWRMMFIVYDGKGYETHLAKSDDLVHWTRLGLVLERGAAGSWDSAQADGGPALFSTEWGGDNRMRKYRDWYWMTYIGGAKTGYETAPLSISVATAKDNSTADKWLRMTAHPVLSPEDPDARAFEDYELFRSFVVQDPLRRLGKEFVMYYNAKRRSDRGESIGMAVSDDMLNWRRYGDGAVLTNGKPVPGERGIGLVGDPMLTKIGDTYVMFYFSAFYPTAQSPAHETFAASKDLVNWTKWTGEPLVAPGTTFDRNHAHKPWVIKHNGVVYHYYCAVGSQGRVVALATSREIPSVGGSGR